MCACLYNNRYTHAAAFPKNDVVAIISLLRNWPSFLWQLYVRQEVSACFKCRYCLPISSVTHTKHAPSLANIVYPINGCYAFRWALVGLSDTCNLKKIVKGLSKFPVKLISL